MLCGVSFCFLFVFCHPSGRSGLCTYLLGCRCVDVVAQDLRHTHTHTYTRTICAHRYCKLEAWHEAGRAAYTLAHVHHALDQIMLRDAAATQFACLQERCLRRL
jgi:hypothetical protein